MYSISILFYILLIVGGAYAPKAPPAYRPFKVRPWRAGADPENKHGGGQFSGLGDGSPPAGSRGGAPVGGLGGRSSPEADDFSQLKGYLDVPWRDVGLKR